MPGRVHRDLDRRARPVTRLRTQDLPSVRQLASDLGVHWNTVARAYRRLADEGLLTVRHGRGAIASVGHRSRQRMSRAAVRSRLSDVVAAALVGGLSREEVVTAFEEALASFSERRRS